LGWVPAHDGKTYPPTHLERTQTSERIQQGARSRHTYCNGCTLHSMEVRPTSRAQTKRGNSGVVGKGVGRNFFRGRGGATEKDRKIAKKSRK